MLVELVVLSKYEMIPPSWKCVCCLRVINAWEISYDEWNAENKRSTCIVGEGIARWRLSPNLNFMFIMFTHISQNNL